MPETNNELAKNISSKAVKSKKVKDSGRGMFNLSKKDLKDDIAWFEENIIPGFMTWIRTSDPVLFMRFMSIGRLTDKLNIPASPLLITQQEIYEWTPPLLSDNKDATTKDIRSAASYIQRDPDQSNSAQNQIGLIQNLSQFMENSLDFMMDHCSGIKPAIEPQQQEENQEQDHPARRIQLDMEKLTKMVYVYPVRNDNTVIEQTIMRMKEVYAIAWGTTDLTERSILPKGFPKIIFLPLLPRPIPISFRRTGQVVNFDKHMARSVYVRKIRSLELYSKDNEKKLANLPYPPTLMESTVAASETVKDAAALLTSSLLESTAGLRKVDNPPEPDSIGGFQGVKGWADRTRKFMESEAYVSSDRARNLLIVGLPGTGKTEMCRALASMFEVPLIELDISAMLGGVQGQSEENLRVALDTISSIGKCVVLIDEVEKAIGGVESSSRTDGGVLMRMVNMLLRFTESSDNDAITVMSANDPKSIPAPLMRSGRMDMIFFAPAPGPKIREEIFDIYAEKYGFTDILKDKEVRDRLVADTENYVGADIRALCNKVHQVLAIQGNVKVKSNGKFSLKKPLATKEAMKLFSDERKHIAPVTQTRRDQLDQVQKWATGVNAIDVNEKF